MVEQEMGKVEQAPEFACLMDSLDKVDRLRLFSYWTMTEDLKHGRKIAHWEEAKEAKITAGREYWLRKQREQSAR